VTGRDLRIARIHFPVTALGPGQRLGIWVQGCELACPGCMSRETWDRSAGAIVAVDELALTWQRAADRGAAGITISGGEPLDQASALAALLHRARELSTTSAPDFLVYTGYEFAEAQHRAPAVLAEADAVITGRFEVTRPTRLVWRGSANQRLIPLTDLGRTRYREYIQAESVHPVIQLGADPDGYWLIGVPRRGDLARLEKGIRDRGAAVAGASWRPERARDVTAKGK
jgi:anaerobic ribonucleoside-triphosphate reductase activating protein